MEPEWSDPSIIEYAASRLDELRRLEDVIHEARQSFELAIKDYDIYGDSVERFVRLQSNALLADALVNSRLLPGVRNHEIESYASNVEPDIVLGLDGSWRSYELGRVLESIEYLYEVAAISHQADSLRPSTSGYPNTRQHIYAGAHLYAHMNRGDELRVRRISYSSPGFIELVSQLLPLSPNTVTSMSLIFLVLSTSPRIVKAWVNIWRSIARTRRENAEDHETISRIRRRKEWNRRISEWYSKALEAAAGFEPAVKAADEVRIALMKIAETDAVDPERLSDRAFESLLALERNVEARKLTVKQPRRKNREPKT